MCNKIHDFDFVVVDGDELPGSLFVAEIERLKNVIEFLTYQ